MSDGIYVLSIESSGKTMRQERRLRMNTVDSRAFTIVRM